jgi:hypothetical protein
MNNRACRAVRRRTHQDRCSIQPLARPRCCLGPRHSWRIGAAVDGITEKFGKGASNGKRGGAAIRLRGFERGYSPGLHVGLRRLRIPTKPATHSNRKPATDSDLKPAGIPI